jgi:hypothetical protein
MWDCVLSASIFLLMSYVELPLLNLMDQLVEPKVIFSLSKKVIFLIKNCKPRLEPGLCSDTILSYIHQPAQAKVRTDGVKVGNPDIL